MEELFNHLFAPANLVLSCLLILLILYWLFTMLFGFDFDLDVDIDVDVDVDASTLEFEDISNAEVDKNHVHQRNKPLKWWQVVLIYFNFVGLPFMFTLTCWIFVWWFFTVIVTQATGSAHHAIGSIIMLIGAPIALFANKILTSPFKAFFKNLNKDGDAPVDFEGRTGTLINTIKAERIGTAEVSIDGNVYSIYVKSLDGTEIPYQAQILIIEALPDKSFYLVKQSNT